MISAPRLLAILSFSLHGAQALADVDVLIDTHSSSTEQFLVTVHTRHADLHNGYSRVRFEGLVQANRRTRVPIDFYISRIGYGIDAYHPDYLRESAVTWRRAEDLPALHPRRWDAALEGVASLPLNGPEPTYAGAVGHAEYYRDHFLPALDRAGVAPDAAVPPRIAALLAKADALAPASATGPVRQYQEELLWRRRHRVLPDIEKLHAATRTRRLALAAYREATAGPKRIVAALQKLPEYRSLLAFVATEDGQKPARSAPRAQAWQDEATGLRFGYRIEDRYRRQAGGKPRDCARGQLTFDGRSIVEGLSGELVRTIRLEFCRDSAGEWGVSDHGVR